MTGEAGGNHWTSLALSVPGLGKARNQDALLLRSTAGGEAVVLAVADGHGSAPHFRSDLGSRWAVEAFVDCATPLAEEAASAPPDRWRGLRAAAQRLPQDIVRGWRERALMHEAGSPAHGTPPPPGRADLTAYGSTFIGAVATRRLVIFWRLGDGDVVLVDAEGNTEAPFYAGPEFGDETDSLCVPEAWRRVETCWRALGPAPDSPRPAVFLSTDGLSKSYADHDDFLTFAQGAVARGVDEVGTHLPDWLGSAAAHSGDDTTLIVLFPATGAEPVPDAPL